MERLNLEGSQNFARFRDMINAVIDRFPLLEEVLENIQSACEEKLRQREELDGKIMEDFFEFLHLIEDLEKAYFVKLLVLEPREDGICIYVPSPDSNEWIVYRYTPGEKKFGVQYISKGEKPGKQWQNMPIQYFIGNLKDDVCQMIAALKDISPLAYQALPEEFRHVLLLTPPPSPMDIMVMLEEK